MRAAADQWRGRRSLTGVQRYESDGGDVAIDLSDNTNRWGMPPAAVDAVRAGSAGLSRYPEMYGESLKEAIAEYAGVPSECVVTGCGSDDVIDLALRAFGEPGDTVAIPDPSFLMVAQFARANALSPAWVPMATDYRLRMESMLSRDPRILYVCSPNNPTGTLTPREDVEWLAAAVRGLVIVDEAYIEFADCASAVDLAISRPNVLVTRTFSKAFGMAGLRVGYGVASPDVVLAMEKARGPFKVSAPAAAAAVAALRLGLPWVREHVDLAKTNRERLAAELRARGLTPAPSSANFVFTPVADAPDRARRMRLLGVSVRSYAGLPRMTAALSQTNGQALRISVGPWDELGLALAALDSVLAS